MAAATVLLLALLAGMIGVGHWRAAKLWRDIQRRSGGHLERETDGFTYTQTMGGRTVATLHAARAIEHTHGQWTLHDVVITTYGRVAGLADRLYGDEFEYNDTTGVARAIGEVQMDLQAPAGLAAAHKAGPEMPESGGADAIHVRTRGLVFVRKLGVAATDQLVQIRYGALTATSRGAEFDSGSSAVHLLGDVHADGLLRGRQMHLTAARADFDRDSEQLQMQTPVLHTAELGAHANAATAQLRGDSSLQWLRCEGEAVVESVAAGRSESVRAPRLEIEFGAGNQPHEAHLTGGVQFRAGRGGMADEGTAAEARVLFDGAGQARQLTAQGPVAGSEQAADGTRTRRLQAKALRATFEPVRGRAPELHTVQLEGGAEIAEEVRGSGAKSTDVRGDSVLAQFAAAPSAKGGELRSVDATGNTVFEQKRADGSQQRSVGDSLHAMFDAGGGGGKVELASADQVGHVQLRSLPATAGSQAGAGKKTTAPVLAEAEHLHYVAADATAVLEGKVRVQQLGAQAGQLQAASLTVNTESGDATAVGEVVAMLAGKPGAAEATRISAERGVFLHGADRAVFSAGQRPVRLWQGGSQVQAASLEIDQASRGITARAAAGGRVQAVFAAGGGAGSSAAGGGGGRTSETAPVVIEASSMHYAETKRVASFEGDVLVRSAEGQVRGQRGDAVFSAARAAPTADATGSAGGLPAGKLERVEVEGDVRVQQPGRTATGDKLVYSAAEGTMLLTGGAGRPPVATVEGEGTVTGASLLFRPADRGVVVGTAAGQRARTVTEVPRKQK